MNGLTLPLHAALALVACGCGAFGYQGLSAKHVGCKAREIQVSDAEPRGRATTWTATCRGKSYLCGGDAEGSVVCREKGSAAVPPAAPAPPSAAASSAPTPPGEPAPSAAPAVPAPPAASAVPAPSAAPAEPAPPAAPAVPAPSAAPAVPLGCQYDTQCKGERICVDGACVDPPAASEPAR